MRRIRNIKDGVRYVIRANGCSMPERWGSEESAIAQAKEMIADGYECSVVMISKSGTDQTATTVWPSVGNCHSLSRI